MADYPPVNPEVLLSWIRDVPQSALGPGVTESVGGVAASSAISSDGFGWSEATIGAVAAFGLMLVGGAIGRRSKTLTH
jgi:hypothetical protein